MLLKGVVILAATNRPDILDPALLRPGRFDRILYVPAPDEKARYEIFKVHTRHMPLSEDVDLHELARITEGYTGADIAAVCREAAMTALREAGKPTKVSMKHFQAALKVITPSVSKEDIKRYEEIGRKMKRMLL